MIHLHRTIYYVSIAITRCGTHVTICGYKGRWANYWLNNFIWVLHQLRWLSFISSFITLHKPSEVIGRIYKDSSKISICLILRYILCRCRSNVFTRNHYTQVYFSVKRLLSRCSCCIYYAIALKFRSLRSWDEISICVISDLVECHFSSVLVT